MSRNVPDIYRDECGGNSRYAPDNNPRDDEFTDEAPMYASDLDDHVSLANCTHAITDDERSYYYDGIEKHNSFATRLGYTVDNSAWRVQEEPTDEPKVTLFYADEKSNCHSIEIKQVTATKILITISILDDDWTIYHMCWNEDA